MVQAINSLITHNPLKVYQQTHGNLQNAELTAQAPQGTFSNLITQPLVDAVQASVKSDQAILGVSTGKISELEFSQTITEANLALQRFRTTYQAALESIKKLVDMPI